MAKTVAQMTAEELKELVALAVEQKLVELLGDPDEGLEIRQTLRKRLLRQKRAVVKGERGELFEDVVRRLKLARSVGRATIRRECSISKEMVGFSTGEAEGR